MHKKQVVADVLFIVQIVCTIIAGVTQFQALLVSAQGIPLMWFTTWIIFLVLNLYLGFEAHKAQPSRVTLQTLLSYSLWMVVIVSHLGVMLWRGLWQWGNADTLTLVITGVGVIFVLLVARRRSLGIADPIVKGWVAVFCKTVPQFFLAVRIFQEGGAGLALSAIITGHITICTRLGQLYFSWREAGWDRNRIGSALSEMGNEATWILVTVAWLMSEN